MKKIIFVFVSIFAFVGIIACVNACQTYLKASELEFDSSIKKTTHTELDNLPPHVPDTIVRREYMPRN